MKSRYILRLATTKKTLDYLEMKNSGINGIQEETENANKRKFSWVTIICILLGDKGKREHM